MFICKEINTFCVKLAAGAWFAVLSMVLEHDNPTTCHRHIYRQGRALNVLLGASSSEVVFPSLMLSVVVLFG